MSKLKDFTLLTEKEERIFKFEEFISSTKTLLIAIGMVSVMLFLIFNYIINIFCNIPNWINGLVKGTDVSTFFAVKQFFILSNAPFGIYIVIFLAIVVIDIRLAYLIRTNYKDYNIGQQGTSRWTTLEEIKQQYKEIPEKTETFKGRGGLPVCRYKDKIYIDDSGVNSLIIGITRSGKGEMVVFPLIDIYSRAEEQASMVVADPKLELYLASYETLKKRGYNVLCLNLIDPMESMGYNPLQLVIDNYKTGDYDTAEMLAKTFSYSIFNPDQAGGDNKFWQTQACNLLTALILAHVEDCIDDDNRENALALYRFTEKQKAFSSLGESEKTLIREALKEALKDAHTPIELKAIFDNEAFIPTEYKYTPTHENEKKVNMYSIFKTCTELSREETDEDRSALDDYFSNRPPHDKAKLKYASIEVGGGKTKGSILTSALADMNVFSFEKNAKMTSFSSFSLEDVGFGEKPVAVFLGIPDYDSSNHFIASAFIKQLYFVLAKKATFTRGGKCKREVIFILDEFGNLPAIDDMAGTMTVCLGRNIRFNLVIQSYSQIDKLYDKGADTITENCGNQLYIMSGDTNTSEHFSKSIGSKTIKVVSRSGGRLSMNKSYTESYEKRPLLDENELMRLKKGECVLKRTMKRENEIGEDIEQQPIYNHGKTKFKYRYKYMLDDFPSNNQLEDLKDVDTRIKDVNLKNCVYNIDKYFDNLRILENGDNPYLEYQEIMRSFETVKEENRKKIMKYIGSSLSHMNEEDITVEHIITTAVIAMEKKDISDETLKEILYLVTPECEY